MQSAKRKIKESLSFPSCILHFDFCITFILSILSIPVNLYFRASSYKFPLKARNASGFLRRACGQTFHAQRQLAFRVNKHAVLCALFFVLFDTVNFHIMRAREVVFDKDGGGKWAAHLETPSRVDGSGQSVRGRAFQTRDESPAPCCRYSFWASPPGRDRPLQARRGRLTSELPFRGGLEVSP